MEPWSALTKAYTMCVTNADINKVSEPDDYLTGVPNGQAAFTCDQEQCAKSMTWGTTLPMLNSGSFSGKLSLLVVGILFT